MCLTLREAHSELSKEEKDISLDTFTRLRPPLHWKLLTTTCQQDSTEAEHCQTIQCETCQGLCTFEHLLEQLGCTLVMAKAWYMKYYQWEEEEKREGKKRFRKCEKYESLYSILLQLHQDWPSFRLHRLIKIHQSTTFDMLDSRRSEHSLLLQYDFSENAEIQEQDEVQ